MYEVSQQQNAPQIPMVKGYMDLSNVWRLRIGSGNSVFKISNGKLWAGSENYATGIFQIDLKTGALITTGTINATGGIFSGDIVMSGRLTAGTDGAKIVLDGTNKKLSFYNDSGDLAASLYNYATGGGSKSLGLDAASSTGEVKLSCGALTRLVAKTVSGKAVIEFYNLQRIYCDDADRLKFNKAPCPLTDNSSDLGTSGYRWSRVYTKSGVSVDGSDGIGDTFGYTDDNGAKRWFVFKGGVLTAQHS